MENVRLTVLDLFCGAGGFSEGFRQQGFEIVRGVDSWQPAIDTFNHNFNLKCSIKNILDFEESISEIEELPDTDVILGSPPCVTFSHSNLSGKADKSTGIKLTEIFLRIVAVKKWKKGSKLKAWFMENVPNSRTYLKQHYTFEDLGLEEWAAENRIGKTKVAIQLEGNQPIINSANYGCPQRRKRVISGEIIKKKQLVVPEPTHGETDLFNQETIRSWITLKEIRKKLPSPTCKKSYRRIQDPNYPNISIGLHELSDHFYDTGLYNCVWRQSKFFKTNHPYMGRMAFPEKEDKPSRTITATNIGTSREAIIYKSEYGRKGDGEYRIPTVREAATLMSFPITYQFLGSEGIKWKLVGNAVCPSVSKAFARQLLLELELPEPASLVVKNEVNLEGVENLNTFSERDFDDPPKRIENSRCRRHPFKDGNITVTLSNYDIEKNSRDIRRWITSIQYGNGNGFPTFNIKDGTYKDMESFIREQESGKRFLHIMKNGFSEKIASGKVMQKMYELQSSEENLLEPTQLVEYVANIIEGLDVDGTMVVQNGIAPFKDRSTIPLKQIFALYAINKIASTANNYPNEQRNKD